MTDLTKLSTYDLARRYVETRDEIAWLQNVISEMTRRDAELAASKSREAAAINRARVVLHEAVAYKFGKRGFSDQQIDDRVTRLHGEWLATLAAGA